MSDVVQQPYTRFPDISGESIVFSAENDLWTVPVDGGRASRLTSGMVEAAHPRLSPDGEQVAFVGLEEGHEEVYIMPARGGEARRLTFDGASCTVVGWHDGAIVYASNARLPFARDSRLHRVDPSTSASSALPVGSAKTISFGPDGRVVLGRHTGGNIVRGRGNAEPATWKRYRGGKAGTLWVDADGDGGFARLLGDIEGNLAHPCWVGDRIYVISDHEGVGNVYSCRPDGSDLHRHSDHDGLYARGLSSDGQRLVYHRGGDLYLLDPADGDPQRVPVELPTSRPGRARRFVAAKDHLEHAVLGPGGDDLALVARGKAFTLAHWEGSVRQHGERNGVRYRLLTWLADHERLVAVAGDEEPDERLVVLPARGAETPQVLDDLDLGRPVELVASPDGGHVAIIDHRNEVLLVDLDASAPEVRHVDRSTTVPPTDLTWSPDGRWIAYTMPTSLETSEIRVADVADGKARAVTRPVLRDHRPAWDPDGRYLYFLGQRDLDPVPDELQFDHGFPLGSRPMLVTLRADTPSPFASLPRPLTNGTVEGNGAADEDARSEDADDAEVPQRIEIDLDGIEDRVAAFPVPVGRYRRIAGIAGAVLFSKVPVTGALGTSPFDRTPPKETTLERFDLMTGDKVEHLAEISDFGVDPSGTALLVRAGDRLRVLPAGKEPPKDEGDEPGRKSGWIDLDRVKVSVRPHTEWRQMFRDTWRLQRDHFWSEDMAGVDWDAIYERYLPLVDRVATRSELSDLIWELQAELGTSHAYEIPADLGDPPDYRQGHLGVDWELDEEGHYRIGAIVIGDVWDTSATSPFNRPGIEARVGDRVVSIDGHPIGRGTEGGLDHPGEALVNRSDTEVEVTLADDDGTETRTVTVRAIGSEEAARYRDWVEANRGQVHERTDGRVGYLHIPDMGPRGFGEFHRGFLVEFDRDALLIDVRFNGGGNVSQLLLEKLARRRRAGFVSRYFGDLPWPEHAPRGPMVALTNEFAGSDGDTFSHVFKLLGLGPLIGTRTWGGVVGIWPRWTLSDGTITTQPEMHMVYDDVGHGIENRGAEPDIEVDITPQDHARGSDPQLDRAVEEALALLEQA
jgi:tricorn protease